ncbi:MAG: TlpA family protein disulfide reductase [Paraprevotella sp.]|nr:TlpA family protein disulfide reductase [Paraprevotella sp.]
MSKYLKGLLVMGALWMGGIAQLRADIQLTVDVTNKTASAVAVVYQTTIVEIPLDDSGHGSHTFQHIDAVHADLYYGMDNKKFFMEEGDRIHISFDGANFKETVKFEAPGGKDKIFKYLNQVTLLDVPEDKMALPFNDFVAYVEKREESMLRIFKAWKLDEVSPRFVTVETGRIRYAYASSIMMYAVGHPFVAKDSTYRPDKAYYDEVRKYAVEDEDLVGLKEYREYMKEVARMFGCGNEEGKTPYDRTLCMMNYVVDSIKDDKVKQTLLNVLAIEQVEQYGIKDIDELLNLHNTYVTDPVLQAAFKEKYDAWDLVRPGYPSPDFRALDADGKSYSVADFKGKYLYIDLWATWCGPCRREVPFLKQLEDESKDRNITFLSLSTDSRKADWLKMVKDQKMTGVQLFLGTGRRIQTANKADGIPHFILLHPERKEVNNNM